MSHTVKLGTDARGNIARIDNALTNMQSRLKVVTDQLDNLYKQQEAAKSEIGKPFPQEQELKDKISRLTILDAELNMGVGVSVPQEQPNTDVSKEERHSVLDSLKKPSQARRDIKEKQGKHLEVR